MATTASPWGTTPSSQRSEESPRVRELARDALHVMGFSVAVSVTLWCTIVALSSLAH
jgi:hypothetical protein